MANGAQALKHWNKKAKDINWGKARTFNLSTVSLRGACCASVYSRYIQLECQ